MSPSIFDFVALFPYVTLYIRNREGRQHAGMALVYSAYSPASTQAWILRDAPAGRLDMAGRAENTYVRVERDRPEPRRGQFLPPSSSMTVVHVLAVTL